MAKIKYIDHNFRRAGLAMIENVNRIVEQYRKQGYSLTLRQVYYQLVAKDMIKNEEKSYKNLGSLISDGRLAGLIDWSAIEDRTRSLKGNSHWGSPGSIIHSAASSYALDKWGDQDYRVEVWVEKEALANIVERAASRLDINFFSCRGYVSQSEMHVAAQRLASYERNGQTPVIIHLGDHDPSGIDMSRDIVERLETFNVEPIFHRVGLNMDQIELYDPPPNPTKLTDSRAGGYIDKFGYESWELDALEPNVLVKLIHDKATEYLDQDKFDAIRDRQERERATLNNVADKWPEIARRYAAEPDEEEYEEYDEDE